MKDGGVCVSEMMLWAISSSDKTQIPPSAPSRPLLFSAAPQLIGAMGENAPFSLMLIPLCHRLEKLEWGFATFWGGICGEYGKGRSDCFVNFSPQHI